MAIQRTTIRLSKDQAKMKKDVNDPKYSNELQSAINKLRNDNSSITQSEIAEYLNGKGFTQKNGMQVNQVGVSRLMKRLGMALEIHNRSNKKSENVFGLPANATQIERAIAEILKTNMQPELRLNAIKSILDK